eukprot:CAMPEP_0206149262 /NCGR_PEP_ID=MMETSP1473-20131121/37686_1 /ASSEMBLY_ACC=CAM_ASM_001109 /TAXON_ID=1461547 /ORGANISM="Stichococcus sp, Strain RCC1054" /LENGTH=87 /DNA_ID=CAMNT_0053546717 /DNA_START=659 /DNA_END=918 /DNA_ORIENTATION=-
MSASVQAQHARSSRCLGRFPAIQFWIQACEQNRCFDATQPWHFALRSMTKTHDGYAEDNGYSTCALNDGLLHPRRWRLSSPAMAATP